LLFPWLLELIPACELYTTENIPGPDFRGFSSWQASNVTGFLSPEFDRACTAAQASLYGTAAYETNHQQALQIFGDQLPILPLFTRIKVAVAHPALQNFRLDPAEDSDWWTVAEWDLAE
jgi:peptide/nickel transport system substrate-binding protein